ncbi:DUF6333 family protein [Streptomyces sp. NBC_01242]|uniref:DUF6333 family protein n=1 Tax=Streptomyces sp. NBC_01242 TaxID=2903795 RepID=UPI00225A2CDB|nr:DUF6333 family protein [Streptomyces sp. NBC_01242]MCX4796006.1 DUF6333 family protein [Streptomyces sp. NBC_01242]
MLRRDSGHPRHVGDLDHVAVGRWGDIVQIGDPAFGEEGILSTHLDAAFDVQVDTHPEARITAACERYSAETYSKYLTHVPGPPCPSARTGRTGPTSRKPATARKRDRAPPSTERPVPEAGTAR